jgi:hypothetical protein
VKDNCDVVTIDAGNVPIDDTLISSPNVNVTYKDVKIPGTCVGISKVIFLCTVKFYYSRDFENLVCK